MISYITSIFNYLFGQNSVDNDDDTDNFLAEQILDIELKQELELHNDNKDFENKELPRDSVCFKRTGIITYINENVILIDGLLYFDISYCNLNLKLNDKVLYLGYKKPDDSVVISRIIENQGTHWGDESLDYVEESKFKVIDHVIVGEVDYRKDRFVHMKEGLFFNLDEVESIFVPIKGDWLELYCRVQCDEEKPFDICATQVLNVVSIRPLRSKMKHAVVTEWTGEYGTCDRIIYFNKQCFQGGTEPCVGSKVILEAIESNQGACVWRAIKLIITESLESKISTPVSPSPEDQSLLIEQEHNIDVTHPLVFGDVRINETATIDLNITNNSNKTMIINKWIVLSKRRDSQIDVNPPVLKPYKLYPKQHFVFTINCRPKFLGSSKEHMIVMFKGFQVNRMVTINVVDNIAVNCTEYANGLSYSEKVNKMRQIRNRNNNLVRADKPTRPPFFVSVKLGHFHIPDNMWSIFLGDSNQTAYCTEFEKILYNIEYNFPCLSKTLNIANYADRWHTLLYMEEIQANINMRSFDMRNIFLIRCNDEYLGVEISGLSERRPSLMKGDRVIVKDSWDDNAQKYEGYIHTIKGNMVLMKFHNQFHHSYSGCDVSIEFHSSRSCFRRSHQAVNLAISNLGVDVLFPSRIMVKPHQISKEKIGSIKWYNNALNVEQKEAVSNILIGECRPLPYCIYGPPGTGKTMTVIETILQITTLLPESRLLIATPSNSAANLITERLLQYRSMFSDSIIRVIANYLLDNDSIPDVIKPYCGTVDIGIENTKKSVHAITNNVNTNCQKSFIGRHRITIGTCYSLGVLSQLGFPRGHFTHVIVDEAGQATEPEIIIPLSFIDKENGQIILAGDPMQLGPVLTSKYCYEFGMGESYFSRIMESFPYQKDYDAYEEHFNRKLITRLKDNYRSLHEVLTLPSAMFYDTSLVAKIDRKQPWIQSIKNTLSEVFELGNTSTGGIYVYGIRGCNIRAEDSPSWYNPQEASMIALTTCKLYKKNISFSDIGIVTPYIAQVRYIRLLFEAMGLSLPKVGSVEEFQGQEKPIIIISTVRSSEKYLGEDKRNALGFVKNPKRMNVALTRAQVGVLLFCDPHLLGSDPLWKRVLQYAVNDDTFIGCDLPSYICKE